MLYMGQILKKNGIIVVQFIYLYTQRKRIIEQESCMCIIYNECDMPIKLAQLIKMCMNDACNTQYNIRNIN